MPYKSNNYFAPLSFPDSTKKHLTGKNVGYIRFFRLPRDVITHTLRDRFIAQVLCLSVVLLVAALFGSHRTVTNMLISRINYN
jgi:hypothetical protein